MPLHEFAIDRWLPLGLGVDDLIALLAALAVLVTMFAIWQGLRARSPFERRLAQIVERRESLRQTALAARPRRPRAGPVGLMRQAVTRLDLLRSRHAAEARGLLQRAGIRSQDAMVGYLFAQITLPSLFGLVMLADTLGLHLLPVPATSGICRRWWRCCWAFMPPKSICAMPRPNVPNGSSWHCRTASI